MITKKQAADLAAEVAKKKANFLNSLGEGEPAPKKKCKR